MSSSTSERSARANNPRGGASPTACGAQTVDVAAANPCSPPYDPLFGVKMQRRTLGDVPMRR